MSSESSGPRNPMTKWEDNHVRTESVAAGTTASHVTEIKRLKDALLRFVNVDGADRETIRFLQIASAGLVRGHRNSA